MKGLESLFRICRGLVIVIVNLIILLCLINFSSYLYYKTVKQDYNPIQLKYPNVDYKIIYPNLTDKEIKELQKETWSRQYAYEQFTQFKEAPFHGRYVNVTKSGFRRTENQGPWPPEKQFYNIFLFGGSTTFNYGVADNETIASNLQRLIGNKVGKEAKVYNFGRGHYYSTQERILLEQLLTSGHIPDMAIFIDGLNDCSMPNDKLIFTDQIASFLQGKNVLFIKNLAIWRLLVDLRQGLEQRIESGVPLKEDESKYNDPAVIEYLTNRYLQNKKIIEVCLKAYHVRGLFIWQPAPTYKYDLKYHLFPPDHIGPINYLKFAYERIEKLDKEGLLGDNFIWCADMQAGRKENFYTDVTHYSASMSELLAEKILQGMASSGLFKD